MSYLFFDTETTGKWDFKAPPTAAHQPHLLQLGAILDSNEGRTVAEINLLLRWEPAPNIEEGAMRVHGITHNLIEAYGVPAKSALAIFNNLLAVGPLLVAHNDEFDLNIVRRAYASVGVEFPSLRSFCTMRRATDICRVPNPNPRYGGYKWPTLDEAYRHFVDPGGFEGAHDAMVDVRACRSVFYEMKEAGYVT